MTRFLLLLIGVVARTCALNLASQLERLVPRDRRRELRAATKFVPCHEFGPNANAQRERLFAIGAIPGVEYDVVRVLVEDSEGEAAEAEGEAEGEAKGEAEATEPR